MHIPFPVQEKIQTNNIQTLTDKHIHLSRQFWQKGHFFLIFVLIWLISTFSWTGIFTFGEFWVQ